MKIGTLIGRFGTPFSGRNADALKQAPPATLDSGVRFPYGPFQFRINLARGATYEIQASKDFVIWIPIAKDCARGPSVEYVDSDAANFSYRYYRVLADGVLSANIIGYASTLLPPGFSMIANPLQSANNTVGEIIRGWPDGTTLNKFDLRLFRMADNTIKGEKWTNPHEKLSPGEGAIFFNPTQDYRSLSFVGEVVQGNLSMPIPAGFSVRSSLVPQPGQLVEDLKFPIADGDVIHLFDRDQQKYLLYPYENGRWTQGTPLVSVGESFWVAKTSAANWTRSFLVNA